MEYKEQYVLDVRWWPSHFLLSRWLHRNENDEPIGRCICDKHYKYYKKMSTATLGDYPNFEYVIPDIRRTKKLIQQKIDRVKNENPHSKT